MTIRLQKDANEAQIKKVLRKVKTSGKPLDVSKFLGKLKWGQDPVAYQRDLRGE